MVCAGWFFDTPDVPHYDTAPMSRAPDERLNVFRLAAASAVVERGYPLAGFPRLADRLVAPAGEARVRLALRSAGEVPTGELQVRAEAMLTCQRCLRPLRRPLESLSRLAFVEREDAPVPVDHEAIVGDPERVDLATLVEDELLLSMPLVAAHGVGEECLAPGLAAAAKPEVAPEAPERRRPFAGLKDLLNQ